MRECDVLFAYMPYYRLTYPALGASILQSCLRDIGISARVAYLGHEYAPLIGIQLYEKLLNSSETLMQGEWTFVEAAFGSDFILQREVEVGRPYPWSNSDIMCASIIANKWLSEVAEKIATNPPRIIVCSSMFQQNLASLAVLKAVKLKCPNITTIMGGPNTEGLLGLGLLRRAPWLDYVCTGEGEITLPALCKEILQDKNLTNYPLGVYGQKDVKNTAGLSNMKIPRASLSNINVSPFPCFDDFFKAISECPINIEPGILLESSRGCWWGERSHCTFCGLNGDGMSYRVREPLAMVSIVRSAVRRYGVKKIKFVDNIISKSYFKDFLPLIEEDKLVLFYETKADFGERGAKQFFDSGVRFIQPGIESLSNPVLKLMRKGTSAALNIECLRLCREYGIRPAWSILCSFPGEREEWYLEVLELLPKLFHFRPPSGFIPIRFDRFSPYHNNPKDWNLDLEPYEAYSHIYPPYLEQHDDIAYFFKQKGRDELTDTVASRWSSVHVECNQVILEWRKYWHERFAAGLEHPQLYLKVNKELTILDDRTPSMPMKETRVDCAMYKLLLFCRKRCSRALLNRLADEKNSITSVKHLNELLEKALANAWIVKTGTEFVSIVQIYNHQQLPPCESPGGRILNSEK